MYFFMRLESRMAALIGDETEPSQDETDELVAV